MTPKAPHKSSNKVFANIFMAAFEKNPGSARHVFYTLKKTLIMWLMQGSAPVLGLLERNAFPGSPPRYIRAVVYDYQFTDFAERRRTGAWWRREEKATYLPPISLRH